MTQISAPLVGEQFTDTAWRDLFGDEPGVVGDLDGSAYAIQLSGSSDVAAIGSTTQPSLARVAGFSHRIPTSEPESITIPAASGSARTDIIALRYDPSFNDAPGPVRLVRIAGSSSGLPAYDSAPPGVEDLPLWGVTRTPGQTLAQATLIDLRTRLAPALTIPAGAPLPLSSPLGTTVRQGLLTYVRQLGQAQTPVWGGADRPYVNCYLRRSSGADALNIQGVEGTQFTDLKVYPITGQVAGTWNTALNGSGLSCSTPGLYGVDARLFTNAQSARYEAIDTRGASTEITTIGIPTNSGVGFNGAGGYTHLRCPNGLQLLLRAYTSSATPVELRTFVGNPLSTVRVTYLGPL